LRGFAWLDQHTLRQSVALAQMVRLALCGACLPNAHGCAMPSGVHGKDSLDPLASFHPAIKAWFYSAFDAPTPPQRLGFPIIARGASTLILAPTGMGKTLSAFLASIDRVMFESASGSAVGCRVVYVSPLKALAIDVERNLKAPLEAIAQVASARGDAFRVPRIALRTGDTPQRERAAFARRPAEILVTTPESLYLLLTSRARAALSQVDTVIIDEIHALVPEKRGSHLALSLERLEALVGRRVQRIGLSATARPVDEVARFLGGATRDALDAEPVWRPVQIVDASAPKALSLRIEVPVEDMRGLHALEPGGVGNVGGPSIWSAIHPRLLQLVREHRSTLIFVNARRSAERLAAALNELAGEPLAYAHHGSLSPEQRAAVEARLKQGEARALVATSSLELGIDMAAVDLVVQIEAPPSVASGLQRIGRAGHQVGAASTGVVFPKYRGDLLVCAALSGAMAKGEVEHTHYPQNPLDVLAQHIVATVSVQPVAVDALYALVRSAAAYVTLSRAAFEGVLDMLSGRYVSEQFAELTPRITWDRATGMLSPRQSARAIAIANAGTIPDRGLYAVYLASVERRSARLGELDEEMVFECKVGETFLLGASSWRIEEITHDRVLVSPAPGEPGRMPFWRGEAKGRSLELGRSVGALTRELCALPQAAALQLLQLRGLELSAARNLLQYLADQQLATRAVPDDRTVVLERCRDEMGDYRVCVLTPWGGRVHAPFMLAALSRARRELGFEVEGLWTDEGFVVRIPEGSRKPDARLLIPQPEELESLLMHELGHSALFAARFRENAARALLLPRRRAGKRTPLWQQRKRAADLLAAASEYPSFPLLLETYRECLRDVFDVPGLTQLLRALSERSIRLVEAETSTPSPFASTLLFGYAANYIYAGDAPLAERRAQALRIDQTQLRELLGETELRELLEPEVIASLALQLQRKTEVYQLRHADALQDTLLRLGDMNEAELFERGASDSQVREFLAALSAAQRIVPIQIGQPVEPRFIAVEDAARYRDALGVALPAGLPAALLDPAQEPLRELLLRYARTHTPFTLAEISARFGLGRSVVRAELERAVAAGKLLAGAFRPGGETQEYVHPDVLRSLRQRSLAKLRKEIEPVDVAVFGRFTAHWHGVARPRAGLDAVLDAVERLQGAALPLSVLMGDVLPARVAGFRPEDLDAVCAAGEVVWCGVSQLGERDGRVSLYLTDQFPLLWSPPEVELDERQAQIAKLLSARGASFFSAIAAEVGGYPQTTLEALFELVWNGLVTNDSLRALRSQLTVEKPRDRRPQRQGFRSRRSAGAPRAAEGRWSLLSGHAARAVSPTERAHAWVQVLLRRYGVVTREVAQAERIDGGFSALYDVFQSLEDAGRIRRGYFVQGVSAMQFALPAVLDQLRALRQPPEQPEVVMLAATDPANPYGALLPWPDANGRTLSRSAGALVVFVDGALCAYLSRSGTQLSVFLPDAEPARARVAGALAERLRLLGSDASRRGLMLAEIDGVKAQEHAFAAQLRAVGFHASSQGFYLPRSAREPVRDSP